MVDMVVVLSSLKGRNDGSIFLVHTAQSNENVYTLQYVLPRPKANACPQRGKTSAAEDY